MKWLPAISAFHSGMGSKFRGTWILEKDENLDQFLKDLGAGLMVRGIAKTVTTTLHIQFEDDTFTIKTVSGPKTKELQFKCGQEISDEAPGTGKVMKGTWVFEGEKMVGRFQGVSGKELVIERDIKDGRLVQVMKLGNTECIRTFKSK